MSKNKRPFLDIEVLPGGLDFKIIRQSPRKFGDFTATNGITLCSAQYPQWNSVMCILYCWGIMRDSDYVVLHVRTLERMNSIQFAIDEYNQNRMDEHVGA